ncbi:MULTISPECIES: SusC/RagA family TonB-linked outer membrane protein [Sphingobacterium]|uniref:SusC/RagA family TonB-linked outer membrane protein n=1 Tax=Sphingobacterium TaxID=28453 RepID=UPI000B4949CD|nr:MULTISPECIES: SusC/RagA family TonB-linked outer membrane protein [Sphingobacterium]
MVRTIIFICSMLVLGTQLQGQILIKGTVLDSLGEAISGVFVSESHNNSRVLTGKSGKFELHTAANQGTLSFQHLGYLQHTLAFDGATAALVVRLKSRTTQLDEVIVSTGYQSIPKERATGSFSTVGKELFNQQVGTDILSRLPVVANSLVMDAGRSQSSPQIMVRGLSTINGPKDPLIVVDNFPYDGDINNINPNTVENITILKDAAASSIWGARAANGVIVITTKKGKLDRPTSFEFNANNTVDAKPDLYYIPQMSSSDFIDVERELYSRGFYKSKISSASKPLLSPVIDLLDLADNGKVSKEEALTRINELRDVDVREQLNHYVYKPAYKQQYFLIGSGGAAKFSWLSSIGYDRNIGTLGDRYERINLRFQQAYEISKQFSVATNLYYTQTATKSGRNGYNDISNLFPYTRIADQNGQALAVPRNYRQSFIESFGDGNLLDWSYYPLVDSEHQIRRSPATDLLGTIELNYEIIKGLKIAGNYQYEQAHSVGTSFADQYSYMARDYLNRFTQLQNNKVEYIIPVGGILDKSASLMHANNLRGTLSFDRKFGKHTITAIVGTEIRDARRESNNNRFYGYNPDNLTFGNIDYKTSYPTVITGAKDYVPNSQTLTGTVTRFVSQFANAAYSFDNRYTVSGSLRRDASNLFGLKTNDQWNPFWSAGAAWKISNEKFFNTNLLSYLNLRTTYGFSGNIDPAMVAVNTIGFAAPSVFTGGPSAAFVNFYNPLLKWETSKMLNIALDFRTKNSRIAGALEFYHKWGQNLFGQAPIDLTTGVNTSMQRNVANMHGQGWDLELTTKNIDHMHLKWNSTLNVSMYKDAVDDYLISRTLAQQYVNVATPPISGIKGKPVYAIYSYRWAGLDPFTGEAQGYLNGEVSKDYTAITGAGTKEEDLKFHGSAVPTLFGNLQNSFSYKRFSLQLGLTYKLGYWYRRSSINYTNLFNSGKGHRDYADRWRKPGDELITNVPVNPYTTNSNRDRFYEGASVLVEKGDHIRLQYINVGYDFPYFKGFKRLHIYLNLQNIGTLWKANKAGIDPDFNLGSGRTIAPQSYSVGVKTSI